VTGFDPKPVACNGQIKCPTPQETALPQSENGLAFSHGQKRVNCFPYSSLAEESPRIQSQSRD